MQMRFYLPDSKTTAISPWFSRVQLCIDPNGTTLEFKLNSTIALLITELNATILWIKII